MFFMNLKFRKYFLNHAFVAYTSFVARPYRRGRTPELLYEEWLAMNSE